MYYAVQTVKKMLRSKYKEYINLKTYLINNIKTRVFKNTAAIKIKQFLK